MTSDIRALVLTPDEALFAAFRSTSQEMGIEAHASCGRNEFPEELRREKYEALLVDFDKLSNAAVVVACIRQSPAGAGAFVFAVATDRALMHTALSHGANVILTRPIGVDDIRRALRASYSLITQERRRYFRLAVDFPVRLNRAGGTIDCRAKNVSRNGMCVTSEYRLCPGEELTFMFQIPSGIQLVGTGVVVWDDKHGKSGIEMRKIAGDGKALLIALLDRAFENAHDAEC